MKNILVKIYKISVKRLIFCVIIHLHLIKERDIKSMKFNKKILFSSALVASLFLAQLQQLSMLLQTVLLKLPM